VKVLQKEHQQPLLAELGQQRRQRGARPWPARGSLAHRAVHRLGQKLAQERERRDERRALHRRQGPHDLGGASAPGLGQALDDGVQTPGRDVVAVNADARDLHRVVDARLGAEGVGQGRLAAAALPLEHHHAARAGAHLLEGLVQRLAGLPAPHELGGVVELGLDALAEHFERLAGGRAIVGVLLEQGHADQRQLGLNAGHALYQGGRPRRLMVVRDDLRLAVEGRRAGDELVEHHARGVHVRGGADAGPLRLLGAHVGGRAEDL
jgi:hypothetical protein